MCHLISATGLIYLKNVQAPDNTIKLVACDRRVNGSLSHEVSWHNFSIYIIIHTSIRKLLKEHFAIHTPQQTHPKSCFPILDFSLWLWVAKKLKKGHYFKTVLSHCQLSFYFSWLSLHVKNTFTLLITCSVSESKFPHIACSLTSTCPFQTQSLTVLGRFFFIKGQIYTFVLFCFVCVFSHRHSDNHT